MSKKKTKKGTGKHNEGNKTPKKESHVTPAVQTEPEDKEKDFYLNQVRFLTVDLERFWLKCDHLEKQNKDLVLVYSRLEKDKNDIIEHLKRSLLEEKERAEELWERLERQQEAAHRDRDALQQLQLQLRQELQEQIQELTQTNRKLEEQLTGLQEFQEHKDQLTSTTESLQKQLTQLEEKHKEELHNLEMRTLLEQKRLQQDMDRRVELLAAEVQQQVEQKLPEETRRILQENVEVKSQIQQLSEQLKLLMEENSKLRLRSRQLNVDVEILDSMLHETSRSSCIQKKAADQLREKCQQLGAEQKDREQRIKELQSERTRVLMDLQVLRQEQVCLSDQNQKLRARMGHLEAELREERRRRQRLRSGVQEATASLRPALKSLDSGRDSEVQWKQMMLKVLPVLNRCALDGSVAEESGTNRLQGSDPAARTRTKHPDSRRPPSTKHKPPPSRLGGGTSSTSALLHRRAVIQQTCSSVSVMDLLSSKLPLDKF